MGLVNTDKGGVIESRKCLNKSITYIFSRDFLSRKNCFVAITEKILVNIAH
jgi:hypothetical protein